MKFIKPSEVSSKIMTLIDESDRFVLIVSPYVKISKWYKLIRKLENVKSRNVNLSFIIRDDKTNQQSFQELDDLNIPYKAIPDLHCKLYLNEKQAVVSSMNLLLSSELKSLDIAYSTETEKEYNELIDFCGRYLNVIFDNTKSNPNHAEDFPDWRNHVCKILTEQLGTKIRVKEDSGKFSIASGTNNYDCFIWNTAQNILRISGILSSKEYDHLISQPANFPRVEGIKIEIKRNGNGYYDTIWGSSENPLKSNDLNNLNENEKLKVSEYVINFILKVECFKHWADQNLKTYNF